MNGAVTAAAVDEPRVQLVTFRLADEAYGVDVLKVQEVLRVGQTVPVPGAPQYVLGIVNLRGKVVTVIDTHTRLGLPRMEVDDANRVVIVELRGQVVGILVDSVTEVVELSLGEIDSAPHATQDDASRYIQGVVRREEDLLIVIDLDKLFTPEELGKGGRAQDAGCLAIPGSGQ